MCTRVGDSVWLCITSFAVTHGVQMCTHVYSLWSENPRPTLCPHNDNLQIIFPIRALVEVYPGWEALNFALEGVPKFSSGEGHFQNENFVLELCKGHLSKRTGHRSDCCGCHGLIWGKLPRFIFKLFPWCPFIMTLDWLFVWTAFVMLIMHRPASSQFLTTPNKYLICKVP